VWYLERKRGIMPSKKKNTKKPTSKKVKKEEKKTSFARKWFCKVINFFGICSNCCPLSRK